MLIVWQCDLNGCWMQDGRGLEPSTLAVVIEEWVNGRDWEFGTGDFNVMRYYPSTTRLAGTLNSGADAAMDMFTDVMFGKGWEE